MSSHNPIHPNGNRDTDAGHAWITGRPSWAQTTPPQTELVTFEGSTFWIAYPMHPVYSTVAGRVAAAIGRGPTIGDALRMAAARA